MKEYAGIGSRETPADVLQVMYKTGQLLAKDGYGLRTGACKGADQAFANGAATTRGAFISLLLPWGNYEQAWIKQLQMVSKASLHITTYDPKYNVEAGQSVIDFHPSAEKLKSSVMALHARNYLILKYVDWVEFVVCWTPGGQVVGGTGQALRIAESQKILIYNLGLPELLLAFKNKIKERGL